MKSTIMAALILALLFVNAMAWQGWFEAQRQMRQWRGIAVSEDQ